MEVIRHAELIVKCIHCMPDEARDGRNVALNIK